MLSRHILKGAIDNVFLQTSTNDLFRLERNYSSITIMGPWIARTISWFLRETRLALLEWLQTSWGLWSPVGSLPWWNSTFDPSIILYNWLIWRVLKLAFFSKSIFPVFSLASGAVRTTPSSCRHIFMRSLIWRWWAFAKNAKLKTTLN